jgi:hypothetical protein
MEQVTEVTTASTNPSATQRVANTASSKILLLTISHKKHKDMNDTRKLTGYDIQQPDSVVS